MRGHIAGRAGVGVVAPGAADVVAALDDEQVVAAVLDQPDGGAESTEAAADDEHADVLALGTAGSPAREPADGRRVGGVVAFGVASVMRPR